MKYARIDDGIVVELFETDGDISQMFHPDLVWVDITSIKPQPDNNWTYDGKKFSPPVVDYVKLAEQEKSYRLLEAERITADWKVELSLGIISDDDKKNLIAWMEYIKRVKLVDASKAPDITWPVIPA
ncbi:TPA: tail fiber assembly protein [Enterobacter bugandensis]|uniref:tail fiber assembly protein n=1 Tax=Enterobacter chuandaensis TaxID=2497875 RepID=UPI00294C61F4|nr:tail fiber assembly protein [Escherichia coli]HCM9448439.1 tail fiber assembly protein [Enterobacter bugandensis]